jgi:hypothetical protein
MTRFRTILFLAVLAGLGVLALAQAISPAMRILSPKAGEKITTNYVTVQYELSTPVSASSSPTFRLQLDGQDPIETTDTQYTFTGLTPGTHSVSIVTVDANRTPISATQRQVQFNAVQEVPAPGAESPGAQLSAPARLVNAAYQSDNQPNGTQSSAHETGKQPESGGAQDSGDQQRLPNSGSGLPLLSVIGMGVLVGGIISALRTRPSSSR